MKKPKKPKLPKLNKPDLNIDRLVRGKRAPEEKIQEAFEHVPKITNQTVAEHREEVISSARKYIYPLQHSRKKIVAISTSIIIAAIVLFLTYVGLALYSFQSTNSFIYGVTQVLPFPVAKVGGQWISYESYLFELRRYMHYYQTQQQVNFSTSTGKRQLAVYENQAMNEVVTDAYTNELAAKYKVSVSNQAVNNEVALVQEQNRLGSSPQELDEVLNDFWGWNENDFKRELKQQMMQQAVIVKLDTQADDRAESALQSLRHGTNFATLAGSVSDDNSTKANGGQFPDLISEDDPNIAPQISQALFSLQPGQISGIIPTGNDLEIVTVLSKQNGKVKGAHIAFNLQPISTYISPLESSQKPHYFIQLSK